MLLYHGTSSKYLDKILQKGIIPRGRRVGNWNKFPSNKKAVYLSRAYPFYFAMNVVKKESLIVFEIDIDTLDLHSFLPDEDFISQTLVHQKEFTTLEEAQKHTVQNIHLYQEYWELSIEKMSNCCYVGEIPPSSITKYCIFDPKKRPELASWMLDPCISSLNYLICGEKYRGLVDWMFEYQTDLPMGTEFLFAPLPDFLKEKKEYWESQSKNKEGIAITINK